jgi:tyrosinase
MSTQTTFFNDASTILSPIAATRNVTVRKSVYDLTEAEVTALRKAFSEVTAVSDNRGFQATAGIHGLPQYKCPHGTPMFLIWHRPYVLLLEQSLQSRVPGLGLPYWDWTSARAQAEGVPKIFADASYKDASGLDVPNPLFRQPVTFQNNDSISETTRTPGALTRLATFAREVRTANRKKDYLTFCPAIESPHNGIHGWVGGTMGDISYAAFDPIFWVHHNFIEKLFCDWQDRVQPAFPTSLAGQILQPFGQRADDVWNYKKLGYRYAQSSKRVLMPHALDSLMAARAPSASIAAPSPPPPPASFVTTFALEDVAPDFHEADLRFEKVRHSIESSEIRVFLLPPGAAAPTIATSLEDNPNYVGAIRTFGHRGCTGDPGHCDPPEVPEDQTFFTPMRGPHHLTPYRLRIDAADALRHAKKADPKGHVDLHLLAVDYHDRELAWRDLSFDAVSLDAF